MVRAREIPAGYELNRAVAKALGWEHILAYGREIWVDPMTGDHAPMPRFAFNMAYAWELVQRAKEWSAVDIPGAPRHITDAKTSAFLSYLETMGRSRAVEAEEYDLIDDYLLYIGPEDICRAFLWAEWGEYLEVEDE